MINATLNERFLSYKRLRCWPHSSLSASVRFYVESDIIDRYLRGVLSCDKTGNLKFIKLLNVRTEFGGIVESYRRR
jgi:hypothetical protein